jgi:predicted HAD superfamily phosphohydrolase YqeG
MGAQFSSATLDDATLAIIKRKTRMKSSEITDWFNELKVKLSLSIFNNQRYRSMIKIIE